MAENETKMANFLQLQKRSLYVGDLHPTVNAIDLYEVFNKVGYIAGVRICCDIWGRSLCYGYVNFLSPFDAAKAMSMLNHTKLKGRPMRIMWCQRNPLSRKTGKANLFVKNLDPSIDSARLDSIFSKFGTVLSCKVAEDEKGKSKGFGFVQFDQEESAMKALSSLHHTFLEGKKLYVCNFVKSSQRNLIFTNLYVKNLKKDVTDNDLKEKFSKFGKIRSSAIIRDDNGISKGYGFVNFESPEDAKRAMEALNGTSDLACESLYVGRAQKKSERERMIKERLAKWRASTVYVKKLDPNVNDIMLKSQFSVCGKVTGAKVMHYSDGNRKGFGLVTFFSPSEAKTAVTTFHGRNLLVKPFYAAKEGERNYPLSVNPYCPPWLPYGVAGNNASHFSSVKSQNHNSTMFKQNFNNNEGLNPQFANGKANDAAQAEFHNSILLRPSLGYSNTPQNFNGNESLNSYSDENESGAAQQENHNSSLIRQYYPRSHWRKKGLTSNTVNGNANASSQDVNRKLLPKKSIVKSTCSSTGSSSTEINITSCKNLHMVVPKAMPNNAGKIRGMKLNIIEQDRFKQPDKSSPLMQHIKDTILEVFDPKYQNLHASSASNTPKLIAA